MDSVAEGPGGNLGFDIPADPGRLGDEELLDVLRRLSRHLDWLMGRRETLLATGFRPGGARRERSAVELAHLTRAIQVLKPVQSRLQQEKALRRLPVVKPKRIAL